MEQFLTTMLGNLGLDYAVSLPTVVLMILAILTIVVWLVLFFFNDRCREFFASHNIQYELVEPVVRMLTKATVRLYVAKASIKEAEKIEQLKQIANLIDTMYTTTSTLRLSELVEVIEEVIEEEAYKLADTVPDVQSLMTEEVMTKKRVIDELSKQIVSEVSHVGHLVREDESDPMVRPKDISKSINKSINAVSKARKLQRNF